MAVHSDSASSEKKSSNGVNELLTFNAENMQSNMKIIYYSRTFLSIIGGVVAGILGFTGLKGFVFYLLLMAFTSLGLVAKAKFSTHTYFDSWNRVLLDGFLGGLMSFVLFWTFAYDIVHIFWWTECANVSSEGYFDIRCFCWSLPECSYIHQLPDSFHNVPVFKLLRFTIRILSIYVLFKIVSQVGRRHNVVLYLWLSDWPLGYCSWSLLPDIGCNFVKF